MNERIQKLIEQCTSVNDDLVYDGSDSYMKTTEYFDKEKFADLLLEEVMQTLFITGHESAFDELNKHFGVEE